jgi:hypothetical protein
MPQEERQALAKAEGFRDYNAFVAELKRLNPKMDEQTGIFTYYFKLYKKNNSMEKTKCGAKQGLST